MGSGELAAGLKPSLNWFLGSVPVSVYLEHFHSQAHLWIFFSSCHAGPGLHGEVLAVILSTFMVALAAGDGRSNWFMGAQLLAVYLILAVAFYFTPG
jgi:Ca2+:H+ antiporter